MYPAICSVVLAPLRREPSDASEMVSQLLFGEIFEVLEETTKWNRVRGLHDGYEGWIDPKQGRPLEHGMPVIPAPLALDPVSGLVRSGSERRWVMMGSPLPGRDASGAMDWLGETWQHDGAVCDPSALGPATETRLHQIAMRYWHAPYLWGGRSPFGIDCSGLVQQVFRFFGKNLPRDAWQQALEGVPVDFSDRRTGDLSFFRNEQDRVVHVGLVFPEGWILHASGEVRLDRLGPEGIFREKEGRWSHQRPEIRRMMPLHCT
jgi:cell wall-associated NlpC family hydrolase